LVTGGQADDQQLGAAAWLDEATGKSRKHRCSVVRAGDATTDPRASSRRRAQANAHSAAVVTGTITIALTALLIRKPLMTQSGHGAPARLLERWRSSAYTISARGAGIASMEIRRTNLFQSETLQIGLFEARPRTDACGEIERQTFNIMVLAAQRRICKARSANAAATSPRSRSMPGLRIIAISRRALGIFSVLPLPPCGGL
jgi:hypothetical protein